MREGGTAIREPDHLVVFYEEDAYLADTAVDFLASGIDAGEAVAVIATPAHRRVFARTLTARGFEVAALRDRGRYLDLDAERTLGRLGYRDVLERGRFVTEVASLVGAVERTGAGVRIYGEMVALLWEQGAVAEALRLEDWWNELLTSGGFALCCGYPLGAFADEGSSTPFREVCGRHDGITLEYYRGLDGNPDRSPILGRPRPY